MDWTFAGWWAGLTPEQQAAWFQGIASVAGLFIAIAVPATQHALSRRELRRDGDSRARSIAMSLLADFQLLADRINDVWAHESPEEVGTPEFPIGRLTRQAFDIPPRLANMADRLHELGPAGHAAQRMLYHLGRAREYVVTTPTADMVFEKKKFSDHFHQATRACTDVLNRIDDMFSVPR